MCSPCSTCGARAHDAASCPLRQRVDYDAAGAAVMRKMGGAQSDDLHAVYTHPSSGCNVFVGNFKVAANLETLKRYGVTHVVNCMARSRENRFEKELCYLRFPVEQWSSTLPSVPGASVIEYFRPVFEWIDTAVSKEGNNVLVHCFAGAHRAGTVGVAYVMHALGINLDEALAEVQGKRPGIDPYGPLLDLLRRLDDERRHGRDHAPTGDDAVPDEVNDVDDRWT